MRPGPGQGSALHPLDDAGRGILGRIDAEIALATPVAADPTEKNQRATAWPPPISANPP